MEAGLLMTEVFIK